VSNGDVLVVAHGHILRAFAMRWIGKDLPGGPAFLLEAGGVGTLRCAFSPYPSLVSWAFTTPFSFNESCTSYLRRSVISPLSSSCPGFTDEEWAFNSYEHHSIDEPAILLGGAFVVGK
jgi:hypothetical protein